MIKTIRNILAETRIRLARGNELVYWVRNIVLLVAGIKILFPVGAISLFLITAGIFVAMFLLGWFDLRFFKLYQREHELMTGTYNPYFKELKRRIKK